MVKNSSKMLGLLLGFQEFLIALVCVWHGHCAAHSPCPAFAQGLAERPLDLFSECFNRVTIITTVSFLLLFSLLISAKKWIINFMKQPASISELW